MKKVDVLNKVEKCISIHRWAPDPYRRGSAYKSKKAYSRKSKKGYNDSDQTA